MRADRSPLARMRKVLHRAGGWRVLTTALFLAAALFVARDSWSVVLLQDVERVLYDVRAVFAAPKADQDPRIAMVVYTDRTLELTGKRSPLDRALLAKDRKSTRLNSSHIQKSRMPSSA